ncbi:hypothetical protein ZWY2020_019550 [Hordeum vulgare]|nr:hypothetical protein ZWY2020_019550 [Hordeum vulgare]
MAHDGLPPPPATAAAGHRRSSTHARLLFCLLWPPPASCSPPARPLVEQELHRRRIRHPHPPRAAGAPSLPARIRHPHPPRAAGARLEVALPISPVTNQRQQAMLQISPCTVQAGTLVIL